MTMKGYWSFATLCISALLFFVPSAKTSQDLSVQEKRQF